MTLNNLKHIYEMLTFMQGGVYTTNTYLEPLNDIVDTSGSKLEGFLIQYGNYNYDRISEEGPYVYTNQTSTSWSNYLVLGTGTTPVTENDYCLENIITSNISKVTSSGVTTVALDKENRKMTKKISLSYVVKNTGTTDITVTEAGVISPWRTTKYNSNVKAVLMHREVFEPVTISAGGVRSFDFEFEITIQLA